MYKEMEIMEFLAKLSFASGDEALDLVSQWQQGDLVIGGIYLEEAEEFAESAEEKAES